MTKNKGVFKGILEEVGGKGLRIYFKVRFNYFKGTQ